MDPTTEIASTFTVGDYDKIRPHLDPSNPQSDAWVRVIDMFRQRIDERFLSVVAQVMRSDSLSPKRLVPGFAILALDCLLIDTIQSFREGRVTTGEVRPAHSFSEFLRRRRFSEFTRNDRDDFFHYVRNGLLHNGETRGSWKVRADQRTMLTRADSGTRTINRTLFHQAIVDEFEEYCGELVTGPDDVRERFLRRMDAICGHAAAPGSYYFAYGSNLLAAEIRASAPQAVEVSVAYLPGWRLVFNKHSITHKGDAASILRCASRMTWGFVYRVSAEEKKSLATREGGYGELSVRVVLVEDTGDLQRGNPVDAFTFCGIRTCPDACGAPDIYLQQVLDGARHRALPDDYVRDVEERARQDERG